jgi:hypothetical protein
MNVIAAQQYDDISNQRLSYSIERYIRTRNAMAKKMAAIIEYIFQRSIPTASAILFLE